MSKLKDTQIHNILKCYLMIGVLIEHKYHNRDSQRLFKIDDAAT